MLSFSVCEIIFNQYVSYVIIKDNIALMKQVIMLFYLNVGPHETPFEDGTFKLMVSSIKYYFRIRNWEKNWFLVLYFIAMTYFRWSFLKITQTSRQLLSFFLKCFIQISTLMEEFVSISYKIGKQIMKWKVGESFKVFLLY